MFGFRVLFLLSELGPQVVLWGGHSRCKFAQLVSDHVLGNHDGQVVLAIVNFESEPDKVGEDGRGSGLRSDGGHPFAGLLGPDNREAADFRVNRMFLGSSFDGLPYGTMCGPV
jgi:hypothetical protein